MKKCLQQAIVETIAPQLYHNTKKAFKIAKMCKRVQAKKDKALIT